MYRWQGKITFILYIGLFLCVLFIASGGDCDNEKDVDTIEYKVISRGKSTTEWNPHGVSISVIEIDRCEYILFRSTETTQALHKENCANPEHKNKEKAQL